MCHFMGQNPLEMCTVFSGKHNECCTMCHAQRKTANCFRACATLSSTTAHSSGCSVGLHLIHCVGQFGAFSVSLRIQAFESLTSQSCNSFSSRHPTPPFPVSSRASAGESKLVAVTLITSQPLWTLAKRRLRPTVLSFVVVVTEQ